VLWSRGLLFGKPEKAELRYKRCNCLTDYKDNLSNLFEIGKEVVAYRSVDELDDLIKYYSAHEYEGQQIADSGQKRTLRENTYFNRMSELFGIIGKHLR